MGEFSKVSHSWIFSRMYALPPNFFFKWTLKPWWNFPISSAVIQISESPSRGKGASGISASVPRHPKKSHSNTWWVFGGVRCEWVKGTLKKKDVFFFGFKFSSKKKKVVFSWMSSGGTSEFLRIGRLSVLEGLCQESEDWVKTCWPGMPGIWKQRKFEWGIRVATVGEEICKNYSHITGVGVHPLKNTLNNQGFFHCSSHEFGSYFSSSNGCWLPFDEGNAVRLDLSICFV